MFLNYSVYLCQTQQHMRSLFKNSTCVTDKAMQHMSEFITLSVVFNTFVQTIRTAKETCDRVALL